MRARQGRESLREQSRSACNLRCGKGSAVKNSDERLAIFGKAQDAVILIYAANALPERRKYSVLGSPGLVAEIRKDPLIVYRRSDDDKAVTGRNNRLRRRAGIIRVELRRGIIAFIARRNDDDDPGPCRAVDRSAQCLACPARAAK